MFILQRINLFINENPYFNDENDHLNTSDDEDIQVDNMFNMMQPNRSNSDSQIQDKSISVDVKEEDDNNMLYLTKKVKDKDQDQDDDTDMLSKKPDFTTHT